MRYETSERLTEGTETMPAHGVYTILRDISEDIRELKNAQYEYARRTDGRLFRLEEDTAILKREVQDLKVSAGVTQSKVSGLAEDVKELRQDIKELTGGIRELTGGISGMQTRLNWWLVFAGIVIALLQYIKG